MTAHDVVAYARQRATFFREESYEHAAIGNELQAEVRRMSAIVLESFADDVERKIAEEQAAV
jgi:hypothetical protein